MIHNTQYRLCTVAELTKESHAKKVKCMLLGDRAIESPEHGSLKDVHWNCQQPMHCDSGERRTMFQIGVPRSSQRTVI